MIKYYRKLTLIDVLLNALGTDELHKVKDEEKVRGMHILLSVQSQLNPRQRTDFDNELSYRCIDPLLSNSISKTGIESQRWNVGIDDN